MIVIQRFSVITAPLPRMIASALQVALLGTACLEVQCRFFQWEALLVAFRLQ